jgi:uncharacterized membrane protein
MPTETSAQPEDTAADRDSRPFQTVLARNIETLVDLRRRAEQRKGRQERLADAITRFTGSLTFVYLHAAIFGAWIVLNLGLTPIPAFDPTFVVLAMAASVEAIFLSTFVLISQNRMAEAADRRAELDLQVSLLAEHEVTKAVEVLDRIAAHLGVKEEGDVDLEEAKQDVDPGAVMKAIEVKEDAAGPAKSRRPARTSGRERRRDAAS